MLGGLVLPADVEFVGSAHDGNALEAWEGVVLAVESDVPQMRDVMREEESASSFREAGRLLSMSAGSARTPAGLGLG